MANLYNQNILIKIETILKGQEKIREATKNYQAMGGIFEGVTRQVVSGAAKQDAALTALARKQKFIAEQSNRMRINTNQVTKAMSSQGLVFDKLGNVTDRAGRSVTNVNRVMNKGASDTKRFKMELLSVMFFGMMLNRTLMGLIKTSLEWLGINEIVSLGLGLLFLPIAEFLLDYALGFLNWVTDLNEEEKKFYGTLVLVGIALSGALMLFGQIGLGLAGVAKLFGSAGTAATVATGKVAFFQTALRKTVGALVGVTITWAGFSYIRSGIEQGSLLKELTGILMMGIGLGVVGLTFAGVAGGLIGFTLGIGIGLIISWSIQQNKYESDLAKRMANKEYGTATAVEEVSRGFSPTGGQGTSIGAWTQPVVPDFKLNLNPGLMTSNKGSNFGQGTNVNLYNTYNISGVSSPNDVQEMIDLSNAKLTEDVRRSV